jgi:AraC family transcriptional regulator
MFRDSFSESPTPCVPFDNAVDTALPPLEPSAPLALHHGRAIEFTHPVVEISPPDMVKRRTITWPGMAAELAVSKSHGRSEHRFCAPVHVLAVYEQGMRRDGETVEGAPRSKLRELQRKMTLVPAGHEYREWHEACTRPSILYFYIDPARLRIHSELDLAALPFAPRLLFEDAALWSTALKLKKCLENPSNDRLYSEALGIVLVHELVHLHRRTHSTDHQVRGGLANWQQRIVTAHIEDHLAEQIPLAKLAELVRLSPYHFCRAFKKSFGVPPHRYHANRRIERAKTLLATQRLSVTDIGLTVGFSETSSFSAAFRKTTGLTPIGYRRSFT